MLKKLCISALVFSITACGAGSGKDLDNQGLPIKDNSGGQPPDQNTGVTLASLQQNIFGAICTNCHTGSNAPRGLRLDSEANSYAFLVSHAADEVPELMRVNPGNPDASYIIRKLEGASGIVGGRMPLGGPYLTQTQINTVRDWIANGAPRSGTGSSATKISKVSAEKNDASLSASVHFSRAIQADTVDANNISLYYTTAESDHAIAVDNLGLLILDQSIEISSNTLIPSTAKIGISIRSPAASPILDSEQNAVDVTSEQIQGSDYRYEYTQP